MFTGESRSKIGPGILVLRHEDYDSQNYDISDVIGLLGKNVSGMTEYSDGAKYENVSMSHGNLMPWFLWANDTRSAPAHNIVWPAMVEGDAPSSSIPSKSKTTTTVSGATSQSGGTVSVGGGIGGAPRGGFNLGAQIEPSAKKSTVALGSARTGAMLPVKGANMFKDIRFDAIGYSTPLDPNGRGYLWPTFPKGWYGVALPTTDEEIQINLFMPTDPRLIAVNLGDDPSMGSMVCDTTPGGYVDTERIARLQSAFRVILNPHTDNTGNAIAIQLTSSANSDTRGGFVIDRDMGDVIGCLSVADGGFIDVGNVSDKHWKAFDGDGNPMNPAHLSVQSLFIDKFDRAMDGPLKHDGYAKPSTPQPFLSPVHFWYDAAIGKHRWDAEIPIYKPNAPDYPTGLTTKTPPPPPNNPNVPSGGGGNPPAGGGGAPPAAPGGVPGGGMPKPPDVPDGVGGGALGDNPNAPPPTPKPQGNSPVGGGPKGGGGVAGGKTNNGGAGNPNAGGKMKVGALPKGDKGFGGWKEADGSDPFNPHENGTGFGTKPGKNGSAKKQKERDEKKRRNDAAKKEREDDNNSKKGKQVGVDIKQHPHDPDNPHAKENLEAYKKWKNAGGDPRNPPIYQTFRGPPPPNAISPDLHPEIPKYGSPTPGQTPQTTTPTGSPGRGPVPSGGLRGPQTPPAMVNELMLPSIILRPQSTSRTGADMRYDGFPNSQDVLAHDRTGPVTAHFIAIGSQGGAVGTDPADQPQNKWDYTYEPRMGRFWGGTGDGGLWIFQPEIDQADAISGFAPSGVTKSDTYLGVIYDAWFAAGKPCLNDGGMTEGYKWGADDDGNLEFYRVDSSGVATFVASLNADGTTTGFGGNSSVEALFGQTADGTVANTVTPTTLLGTGVGTVEIPADIAVGNSIRVLIRGKISQATAPTGQMTVTVAGNTVLDSGTFGLFTTLANAIFDIEIVLTCRDLTTPSAAVFDGVVIGTFGSGIQFHRAGDATFSGTIDTTASMPIDLLWTWSAANAGNTITSLVTKVDLEAP